MDINDRIKDIRRSNLKRLINESGTASLFARKHQLDATYLSQIINGHRNLGEKSARNFEQKIGIPLGSLDAPSRTDTKNFDFKTATTCHTPFEIALLDLFRQIPEDQQPRLLGYIESKVEDILDKKTEEMGQERVKTPPQKQAKL